MAIGFISVKIGYVKKETTAYVAHIVTRIVFPAWIVAKLLSNDVTVAQIVDRLPLFVAGITLTLALMLLGILLSKLLKLENRRKYVFIPLIYTANSIFMGIPICQGLFGDSGALSCTILALGVDSVLWTAGISFVSAGGAKVTGEKIKNRLRLNPVTVAFFLSFVIKLCGFSLPELLQEPLSKLGGALSYLAMIYLGMSLTTVRFGNIFKDRLAWFYIPFKSFVIPLCVNILVKLTGLFSPEYVGVLTVVFSASPAVSMTMFYREYGLDYELGNSLTFACVVLDIITIPFMYWLCGLINF